MLDEKIRELLISMGYSQQQIDAGRIKVHSRVTVEKFDGEYKEGAEPVETVSRESEE